MKIKKLELKNFRGFEDLTIDFPEGESGLAVFVGVNGSGKTSVLDAIAFMLREIVPNNDKNVFKTEFEHDDIKIGSKDVFLELHGESQGNDFSITPLSKRKGFNHTMVYLNNERLQVPILAYYKTNRELSQSKKPSPTYLLDSRIFAYSNAFSPQIDNFQDLLEWFRYQEDIENQEKVDRKDFNYTNPSLQVVRQAVSQFLSSLNAKFDNLKVRRIAPTKLDFREPAKEWSLVISKNDTELKINQLSSGERALISLISDIARRAAIANPQLSNPLMSEGVVLIDEIELHLHPAWQRNATSALRATFPNIQFILTTHSPQVLSNVPRENVFVLEDFKLVKTPHTFGRDSNSILWDLFAVESRPDEAKKDFKKLYQLIDDPDKKEEAEAFLNELEEKYGNDDPELVSAGLHLKFLTA